MIKKTNINTDIQKIRESVSNVYHHFDDRDQISVTCRPGCEDPLYDGVGSLLNERKDGEYNVIVPEFKGTIIEEFLEDLPFRYGRTRLLRMQGRKCYGIHWDESVRYHLAIFTNRQALILHKENRCKEDVFQEDIIHSYHIPADGYLYEMDATKIHTAINSSTEERIHLVIAT